MSEHANQERIDPPPFRGEATYTYAPTTYVGGRINQTDYLLQLVNQHVPRLFPIASRKLAWSGFRPANPLEPFTS